MQSIKLTTNCHVQGFLVWVIDASLKIQYFANDFSQKNYAVKCFRVSSSKFSIPVACGLINNIRYLNNDFDKINTFKSTIDIRKLF